MSDNYELQRTSLQSAAGSDKVLAETTSPRLLLCSVLVENHNNPDAKVKISLIHQRKSPKGSSKAFYLDLPELFIRGKRISGKLAPIFFVNTARKNTDVPSALEKFMMQHECALTTAEPWINKIFNIPAGARVMLYANRLGVIATGVATPAHWIDNPPEFEGDKAHILRLREFRKLKQPLSVQELFRVARKTYRVSSVYELHGDAGKRVWDAATHQL